MTKSSERTSGSKKPGAKPGRQKARVRPVEIDEKHVDTPTALAASEERLLLFTEAIGEVVFDWDIREGRIYHSSNMFAVLGIDDTGIKTPRGWVDRIDPSDASHFRQALIDYFKQKSDRFEHEFRIKRDDGNWQWVRQHAIGQRGTDGRVFRLTGAIGDITESRRTREALSHSDERFRVLVEGSIQGIVIQRNGDIVFANQSAADMHAYDLDSMIGMQLVDFLAPESIDKVLSFSTKRAAGEDLPSTYEYYGRRKDGSEFPVQLMANPITWADAPAIQYTLIDITEQKRAESLLRDAIESIADGFVLFDRNDRLVVANQRFAEYYPELAHLLRSTTTAEDMFRERARSGAVGDFDIPVEEYVRWRMDMRRKDGGTPSVHRHADGRWLRTTERKTSDGGIVAISTDVTELKQREADLAISKALAETANRAKSEFLANMSHELRTPLNAIIGFSEAMEGEYLGPLGHDSYREYVQDIRASGNHLLQIINDLLDLSKIEAGKLDLDEHRVNMNAVVTASMRIIRERAKDGDIDTVVELADPAPRLWADERACKQIMLNLLSNAVKFTPPGGRITVSTEVEKTGETLIRVSDSGIGIPEGDRAKILEPFIQVESSLVRNHAGTGLGLPLTKAIVDLHGGTLALESTLGEGTTVTVRFPAERAMRNREKSRGAA